MSPFENSITSFQMMGAELRRMLFEIQSGSCAFYPTSGLKQIVQMNLLTTQKQTHTHRKPIYGYQRGKQGEG